MDITLTLESLLFGMFINFGMFAGLFTILTILPSLISNLQTRKYQIFLGLIFGATTCLSILFSVEIMPGVIVDSRMTILAMTAMFFSPLSASIATAMAIVARLYMGGSIVLGITVILFSTLFGLFCRYILKKHFRKHPNIPFIAVVSIALALIIPLISVPFLDLEKYAEEIFTIMLPAFTLQTFISSMALGTLLLISYKNYYLEGELGRVVTAAKEINNAKTEFLAMMSHEIRTPMNGVLGFTEILSQTDLDDYQQHCLKQIKTAGTTMMRLLDDILDFSKIDSGKFSLSHTPLNLTANIKATVELMEAEAAQNKNKLDLKINSDVPEYVFGDTHRIRQILYNLISNAIKFTENGLIEIIVERNEIRDDKYWYNGVEISNPYMEKSKELLNTSIKSIGEADGIIVIHVKDNGRGITLEKQKAIFSAFEQEDKSISRQFGGSGLGLAIVKKLLNLMGGKISLKSMVGKGSTFKVEIPYIVPDQEQIDSTSEDNTKIKTSTQNSLHTVEQTESHIIGDNRFILLVEDIEMNQELAASILMQHGFQVHVASDGIEAIDAIKNNGPFNLVLMDIRMPQMNGIQATKVIREELHISHEDLPIVALTAHVIGDEIKESLKAGMDDYISKPIKAELLLKKVDQWARPAGLDSFDDLLHAHTVPNTRVNDEPVKDDAEIIDSSLDSLLDQINNLPEEAEEEDDFVVNPFSNKTSNDVHIIDEEMLEQFMSFMGREKILSVFDVFKDDIKNRLKEIEESNMDGETVKSETHALASTAGNLGMMRLSLFCRETMDLVDESASDKKSIKKRMKQLQKICDESCEEFTKFVA